MIEVVCAVVVVEGRVLLCKRPEGAHLAGHWEFPGGKVEEGEDAREALRREIREELGCTVRTGRELACVEHRYREVAIRLRPIRCEIAEGEPAALEHEQIGWFGADEIGDLELAGADRIIWQSLATDR